jgi:predicted FMN-binding regulatory protein PaiB
VPSLVVFQGPDAYVSPSWYPSKAEHGKVVPTWNYVMVQARGRLRAIDDPAWLLQLVTRLTERHEAPRSARGRSAMRPRTTCRRCCARSSASSSS